MPENRFESIYNEIGLKDNQTGKEYVYFNKEVIDLLNEQHERIEDYNVALKTLQDLADKKLKENEQLKKRIEIYDKCLDENDLYFAWSNFCTLKPNECVHDEEFDCEYCQYIGWKE